MMGRRGELSKDATLEDVLPTLLKPENHVRVVLKTMQACRRDHGNAHVRIGITGEGKVPYHKVTYFDAPNSEQLFGAYDGQHEARNVTIHESTWSCKSSSFEEVQALLGRIRGYKT
jgi:hypothetical protein